MQSGTDRTHAQWLRQGELKYVRYFVANEPEELYDLSVDPDELVNKVDDPRYGSQLAALRRSWRDELRRSGADFLDAVVEP